MPPCSRFADAYRGGHGCSTTVAILTPFCSPFYPPLLSSLFTLPSVVTGTKFLVCARPDEDDAHSLSGRRVKSFPAQRTVSAILGILLAVDELTVPKSVHNFHHIVLFVGQEGTGQNRLVRPYRPYQLCSPPYTGRIVPPCLSFPT